MMAEARQGKVGGRASERTDGIEGWMDRGVGRIDPGRHFSYYDGDDTAANSPAPAPADQIDFLIRQGGVAS